MAESNRRRRTLPEAFKMEAMAVAAIRGGRSLSEVAAELGLPDRLVRAWLRWAEVRPAEANGAPAPTPQRERAVPASRVGPSPADQAAEIAGLRKELDRIRMPGETTGSDRLRYSDLHRRVFARLACCDERPEPTPMLLPRNGRSPRGSQLAA